MKYVFLLLCSINIFCAHSQKNQGVSPENRHFDEVSESFLLNDKGLDSREIVSKGDSLYKASVNDWQRTKSSFVIIYGYEMLFDWNNALKYALRADSIASRANIKNFRPRTNGILASIYSKLNLPDKSFQYLDKALLFSEKLDKKEELYNKSMIYQRMAATYARKGEREYALSNYQKGLEFADQLKKNFPDDDYSKLYMPILMNIGVSYLNLKEYDLSKTYLQKALPIIIDSKHNLYLAYCYVKLAAVELRQNNPDSAFVYILKSKELADKLNERNLEYEINHRLDEYYTSTNDLQKLDSIKRIIIENYQDIAVSRAAVTQNILNRKDDEIKWEKELSFILIIIAILLVIVVLAVLIYHRYHNKQVKAHFNKIIEEFENKNLSQIESSLSPPKEEIAKSVSGEKEISLPEKTVSELLQKLESFENGTKFTTKNFTISSMASLMRTNTKYINYILQQYRGKNFNEYLNGIRIKYIVQKMINDPKYLNYKIEYLSEIAGYSSHSRFTQMFKKEMKMSPSEFITQLTQKDEMGV